MGRTPERDVRRLQTVLDLLGPVGEHLDKEDLDWLMREAEAIGTLSEALQSVEADEWDFAIMVSPDDRRGS